MFLGIIGKVLAGKTNVEQENLFIHYFKNDQRLIDKDYDGGYHGKAVLRSTWRKFS